MGLLRVGVKGGNQNIGVVQQRNARPEKAGGLRGQNGKYITVVKVENDMPPMVGGQKLVRQQPIPGKPIKERQVAQVEVEKGLYAPLAYLNRGDVQAIKQAKILGKGGFGVAREIVHKEYGHCAVKEIPNEQAYRDECAKMLKIKRDVGYHDNLLNLHGITKGSKYDPKFIFMDLGGPSLFDRLRAEGSMKGSQLRKNFHQMVSGVNAMNEKGWIHNDIKPENILMAKDNNSHIKICDYGLAEKKDTFSFGGSYEYNSPEKFLSPKKIKAMSKASRLGELVGKADSWSLGCVFAEMSLGLGNPRIMADVLPKPGVKISRNHYNNIDKRRADISRELEKREGADAAYLFLALTEIHPQDRMASDQALNHPYFKSLKSQ